MSTTIEDASQVDDILQRTWEIAKSPSDEKQFGAWRAAIHAAHAATLVDVTARLSSEPGKPSRDVKALREAVISEIERKNAQDVITTMKKLDASATRLTLVSLVLAVVGVALTIVQVFRLL